MKINQDKGLELLNEKPPTCLQKKQIKVIRSASSALLEVASCLNK